MLEFMFQVLFNYLNFTNFALILHIDNNLQEIHLELTFLANYNILLPLLSQLTKDILKSCHALFIGVYIGRNGSM